MEPEGVALVVVCSLLNGISCLTELFYIQNAHCSRPKTQQEASLIEELMKTIRARNPGEEDFHQAVEEVANSVIDWYCDQKEMVAAKLFERMAEPDRVISFRVTWEDDEGALQYTRGWRVQFNHVIGPYKGGLRFADGLQQGTLKFLGFEQIFKNALTGQPMGGAKGGADFNPKGRSQREINRFCHSFMNELHRHIGPDRDVPAGDIGVGAEEISALFGQYLKLTNEWKGSLTGKGCNFGGSAVRTEATGYGCVYFCAEMLQQNDIEFADKRVAISGAGNVALHAALKAIELDAKVVTLSDSGGTLVCSDGFTSEQIDEIKKLKTEERGSLSDYSSKGVSFSEDEKPWQTECDIAMPCATQNEVEKPDAEALAESGVQAICEGANMPLTGEAAAVIRESEILHGPGKAANAGGVAVSGFELSQNASRMRWTREEVDKELRDVMKRIHKACLEESTKTDAKKIDYVKGANLAGFKQVANAMHSYGVY